MTVAGEVAAQGRGAVHYHSHAFGLSIASDFPISELPQIALEADQTSDIDILKCDGIRVETSASQPLRAQFRTAGGPPVDELHWHGVGSFRISGTRRIEYDMHPDMGLDVITLPLLGTVMALLLHRRGLLVLHGSAVQIEDRAVVFVGDKGAGKSTTAASLVAAGRRILTDDIVALERTPNSRLRLLPGYGQIKLTQMATDAIDLRGATVMERPFETFTKNRHVLAGCFDRSPLEVSDIHILERGDRLAISPFEGHASLTSVMRFAYLTRFGSSLFTGDDARFLLDWSAEVARKIRVSRLEVPSTIEGLGELDRFLTSRLAPLAAST